MLNSLFPLLLDYYRIGNAYTNYSFVKLNMYPLVPKERNHTKQPNLSIFMIVQMKMKWVLILAYITWLLWEGQILIVRQITFAQKLF